MTESKVLLQGIANSSLEALIDSVSSAHDKIKHYEK